MAQTYECIATSTLASATSTVTFSNIPSTYTDLVLSLYISADVGIPNIHIRYNGDSGTNYSGQYWYSDGTTVGTGRYTSITEVRIPGAGTTTNRTGCKIDIAQYSNTSINKTSIATAFITTSNGYFTTTSLWRSTAAIYQISISPSVNNWTADSKFTLYGIKAA